MTRPHPPIIMAVCCASMMAISLGTSGPALCAKLIQSDFGMSDFELGVFLGAAIWGLVVAILLAGPLADRFGFRVLLAASAFIESAGLLLMSLATSQALLLAGAIVFGLGAGIVDALTTPIICAVYADRRVRMSNLLHAFYAAGLIFTSLLFVWLIALDWPWRAILLAFAAVPLPFGVGAAIAAMPAQSHQGPRRMATGKLLASPVLLLFLLAIALGAMTEFGACSWLPKFVAQTCGGNLIAGAVGLIAFGSMMLAGRLTVSAVAQSLGPRRLFLIGGGLCAASLVLAALPIGTWWTILWLAVLGFGVAGFWPTIVGSAGDRFPQAGATMFALLAAMGNIGASCGPIFIGAVANAAGLPTAMALLAAAPAMLLILSEATLRPSSAGRTTV